MQHLWLALRFSFFVAFWNNLVFCSAYLLCFWRTIKRASICRDAKVKLIAPSILILVFISLGSCVLLVYFSCRKFLRLIKSLMLLLRDYRLGFSANIVRCICTIHNCACAFVDDCACVVCHVRLSMWVCFMYCHDFQYYTFYVLVSYLSRFLSCL